MTEEMGCPKCGGETVRDEVDVGVGIMHGPWHCIECGWSQGEDVDKLFRLTKEEL